MIQFRPCSADFEFYYLVELTRQKVKPLSRWEKTLTRKQKKWLQKTGLKNEIILRVAQNGTRIYETIFSDSARYLDFYRRRFSGTVLERSESTQRIEGFLFGYPSCCVQQFIHHPYQPNFLDQKLQQKLFHWTCPHCRITPELLPYYLFIHNHTLEWYRKEFSSKNRSKEHRYRRLSAAVALALLLSTGSIPAQVIPDSSHYLPIWPDLDQDYLADFEEVYLGSNFFTAYTMPGVTDNLYWTQFFKVIIDSLPTTVHTDRPYRLDFPAWGLENCQICGEQVNMGFIRIINPLQNRELDIPYIGLHFLAYHCFSFDGTLHTGRMDVDALKQILYPFDPAHMLPVVGDSDQDGLTDSEEDSLNFNPMNNDTNEDGIPDGAEVAAQLTRLFPQLKDTSDGLHTCITLNPMYGTENCEVCGATHNMGMIEFHNPETGRMCQIHFNALHALAHGSFASHGTSWPYQRISAVALYRTMKTHHLPVQNDRDQDGLLDAEESYFGYDPIRPDSDGDGITDGMELALALKSVLDSLPTSPGTVGPHVVHHPTFGFWNCLLCGMPLNMGYLEIWHPQINGPFTMSYYAYHFLEKGSFSYEGRIQNGQWMVGRLDPILLSTYLDFIVPIKIHPVEGISSFRLHQNYPNPFNLHTTLRYELNEPIRVEFVICNLLGEKVKTLVNGYQKMGQYQVTWDGLNEEGKQLASGIYLYTLKTAHQSICRKMMLLK